LQVAAIYDIHGNLPALEATLAEIEPEGAAVIVIGGDVASGPMPAAVIDRLIALGDRARFLRGNADRHLVSAFDQGQRLADVQYEKDPWLRRGAWEAEQISREQRDFLASFPENAVLEVGGLGETLFCHGSPRSDEEIITPGTTEERLSVMLAGVSQPAVVCGHTHMQFDRRHGQIRIVNAGSVGMPYEGQPGAYWALLGPDVDLRRTDYDFDAAADAIRKSGFPESEGHVTDLFLEQPGRDEVTEFFEQQAERAGTPPTSQE
jgi:predicted phosphodiesterase